MSRHHTLTALRWRHGQLGINVPHCRLQIAWCPGIPRNSRYDKTQIPGAPRTRNLWRRSLTKIDIDLGMRIPCQMVVGDRTRISGDTNDAQPGMTALLGVQQVSYPDILAYRIAIGEVKTCSPLIDHCKPIRSSAQLIRKISPAYQRNSGRLE